VIATHAAQVFTSMVVRAKVIVSSVFAVASFVTHVRAIASVLFGM